MSSKKRVKIVLFYGQLKEYKMTLHLPDHFVEKSCSFRNVSVLDAAVYEQFYGHIKKSYRGSRKKGPIRIERIFMLMKWHKRAEWCKRSTEADSILPRMIHNRVSRRIGVSSALVQPSWIVCLDEIVACVDSGSREEEMNENVKLLFNVFWNHAVEVLVPVMKERLQD